MALSKRILLPSLMVVMVAVLIVAAAHLVFQKEQISIYFGNLHNHTLYSDGKLLPEDFINEVKINSGYDFISLTEHSHDLSAEEFAHIQKISEKSEDERPIILSGQEFSQYSPDNLINIQNYPFVVPREDIHDYKKVLTELNEYKRKENLLYAEFNHPRDILVDYGMRDSFGGDRQEFVRLMDPVVQLIALDSGSLNWFGPTESPDVLPKKEKLYRYVPIEQTQFWFQYLLMGMHLGPKVDTSYHTKFPGRLFAARTAVWVRGPLTRKSLLEALSSRRTYVSEDLNLKISAQVNKDRLPGDVLSLKENKELKVLLGMEDTDEPRANYRLTVLYGEVGGKEMQTLSQEVITVFSNKSFQIRTPLISANRQYYIIKVEQLSRDPINASERNVAWLSPIWFE